MSIGKPIPIRTCWECDKEFSTKFNLNKHLKNIHKIIWKQNLNKPFQCAHCDSQYYYRKALVEHMRAKHPLTIGTKLHSKTSNYTVCYICKERFIKMNNLRHHFTDVHNIKIEFLEKNFANKEDFMKWKETEEKATKSQFTKHCGAKKLNNGDIVQYYECSRSGAYQSKAKPPKKKKSENNKDRRRSLKKVGTRKLQHNCTASITLTISPEKCNVKYWSTHVGHECEFDHLTRTLRQKILHDKILSGEVLVSTNNKRFSSSARRTKIEASKKVRGAMKIIKRSNSICTSSNNSYAEKVPIITQGTNVIPSSSCSSYIKSSVEEVPVITQGTNVIPTISYMSPYIKIQTIAGSGVVEHIIEDKPYSDCNSFLGFHPNEIVTVSIQENENVFYTEQDEMFQTEELSDSLTSPSEIINTENMSNNDALIAKCEMLLSIIKSTNFNQNTRKKIENLLDKLLILTNKSSGGSSSNSALINNKQIKKSKFITSKKQFNVNNKISHVFR